MSIEQVVHALNAHETYLVVSHVDLEGDALGSQMAAAELLERLGKRVVLADETPPPKVYSEFPGVERVRTDLDVLKRETFQAVVTVDCPTLQRIGRAAQLIGRNTAVINIDHHVSNTRYGAVNWVNPDAAACGELIYDLFQHMKQPLSPQAAEWLYLSLLIDTGGFRFSNTTAKTFAMAADLVRHGVSPSLVYERLYEHLPSSTLLLLGETLKTLSFDPDGRLAWFCVTSDMMASVGAQREESETFIDMVRAVDGVQIIILFTEIDSRRVKVSFRGRGEVDVNDLAAVFGGGGHRRASACVCEGALRDVQALVLAKAREALSI